MPQDTISASAFSPDAFEFIALLHRHNVHYMIVGGEAVIFYGHVRLTGDIDFYYDRESENVERLFQALSEFWGGPVPGISEAEELSVDGVVVQFGRPPNRIDLLNRVDGLEFEDAWPSRKVVYVDGGGESIPAFFIGMSSLIANKRAAGRPKDLDDLSYLEAARL